MQKLADLWLVLKDNNKLTHKTPRKFLGVFVVLVGKLSMDDNLVVRCLFPHVIII